MVFKVGMHRLISVTPLSEFVVAPAGYSLKATIPFSFAVCTSSGFVSSVRYSVIRGSKSMPSGTACRMRLLYSIAWTAVALFKAPSCMDSMFRMAHTGSVRNADVLYLLCNHDGRPQIGHDNSPPENLRAEWHHSSHPWPVTQM